MTELNTQIRAVTVYTDRARITRSGNLSLEPGLHKLEVSELPVRLLAESLRATARGTARARLLGVQAQRAFFVETPQEQIRELENQIEAAKAEAKRLEARAGLVTQNRATLEALAGQVQIYATGLASGETSVEAQLSLFDSLRARSEKLDDELQEIGGVFHGASSTRPASRLKSCSLGT